MNETKMERIWNKHKTNTPHNTNIFIGLSGGVDSSVAALLLKKQGYKVTGVYMKNWSDPADLKTGACTWIQDRRDAIKVAAQLGIAFHTFDFEKEYRAQVIENLFSEYKNGRTPNPDILCNKYIKFDLFWQKAQEMEADYIATGHYASIKQKKDGSFGLFLPKDKHKDQTYFLSPFTQEQLSHVLFPLNNLTKQEVREIARKNRLATAEKKDSMGICFVGEVPIMEFLSKKLPKKNGDVLDVKGKKVGEHHGAYFYTIGQRHGFTIFNKKIDKKACYIIEKNVLNNTLTIAEGKDAPLLRQKSMVVGDIHWISGQNPKSNIQWKARIRHGQQLQDVEVSFDEKDDRLHLTFSHAQQGVAPGQSVVFFHNDEVLGGAIIL